MAELQREPSIVNDEICRILGLQNEAGVRRGINRLNGWFARTFEDQQVVDRSRIEGGVDESYASLNLGSLPCVLQTTRNRGKEAIAHWNLMTIDLFDGDCAYTCTNDYQFTTTAYQFFSQPSSP